MFDSFIYFYSKHNSSHLKTLYIVSKRTQNNAKKTPSDDPLQYVQALGDTEKEELQLNRKRPLAGSGSGQGNYLPQLVKGEERGTEQKTHPPLDEIT